MSDFQQAPDWWLASDGKWYSPEPVAPLPGPPLQPPVYDPNAYQQGFPAPLPTAPGYQQPYQPYPVGVNPFESRGTTVLVLGILGLVACGVLGPVAWVMGNGIKKEAAAAGFPEPGNSKAGRICGIISCCLWGLLILLYAVLAIVAVSLN